MVREHDPNLPQSVARHVAALAVQEYLPIAIQERDHRGAFWEELKDSSGIVVFNHIDRSDVFRVTAAVTENNHRIPVAIPPALKYADGQKGKTFQTGLRAAAPALGMQLWPVLQKKENTEEGVHSSHIQFFKKAVPFLSEPGRLLILAPEETRSQNGALKEAETGITNILRSRRLAEKKVVILPVGVYPPRNISYDREAFNRKTPFILSFGEPVTKDEILKEAEEVDIAIQDVVLLHIARLLPKEMRGHYAEFFEE